MSLTIRAKNFRVLHELNWSPEGVCLLAGPNGSGKTTALELLSFMRAVFHSGPEAALNTFGSANLVRQGAGELVVLQLELGDVQWSFALPMSPTGSRGGWGEQLSKSDVGTVTAVGVGSDFVDIYGEPDTVVTAQRDERSVAKMYWDGGRPEWMQPFVKVLSSLQVFGHYSLASVRRGRVETGATDRILHHSGSNLWAVLSTWAQAPIRFGDRFQWVLHQARRAFPGIVGAIEFDRGLPLIFGPAATDPADGLPPDRAADGVLVGLCHLTAVAGAEDSALIAFDELENHLHPHAIRTILTAMRERAEAHDLTIILTTHSPVVMNAFKGHEDQFYVLGMPSPEPVPRALDELHDAELLGHHVLGDLYEHMEIAAPKLAEESAE